MQHIFQSEHVFNYNLGYENQRLAPENSSGFLFP